MAAIELVHAHKHLVGFRFRQTTTYPHKPPQRYWHYRVNAYLLARAHEKAGCGGPESDRCRAMHKAEHAEYRRRRGLPPPEGQED